MKTPTEAQTRTVNHAFESLSTELKRFRQVCGQNDSPIRAVTFRVVGSGQTKTHVTYRRK